MRNITKEQASELFSVFNDWLSYSIGEAFKSFVDQDDYDQKLADFLNERFFVDDMPRDNLYYDREANEDVYNF